MHHLKFSGVKLITIVLIILTFLTSFASTLPVAASSSSSSISTDPIKTEPIASSSSSTSEVSSSAASSRIANSNTSSVQSSSSQSSSSSSVNATTPSGSLKFTKQPKPLTDNKMVTAQAGCYYLTKISHEGMSGRLFVFESGQEDKAEKLADYVVIIDSAEVIARGTVAQLKAKYGQGNLLQVNLNPQTLPEPTQVLKMFVGSFESPKMVKETVTMLVSDQAKSLTTALEIVKQNQLDILNINIKEPSLEDIFLLLTGKEVRE